MTGVPRAEGTMRIRATRPTAGRATVVEGHHGEGHRDRPLAREGGGEGQLRPAQLGAGEYRPGRTQGRPQALPPHEVNLRRDRHGL